MGEELNKTLRKMEKAAEAVLHEILNEMELEQKDEVRTISVPASQVQVGHIVDNRCDGSPLEVMEVEPWTYFGKNTYKITIGRNGQVAYKAELLDEHVLTYHYLIKKGK